MNFMVFEVTQQWRFVTARNFTTGFRPTGFFFGGRGDVFKITGKYHNLIVVSTRILTLFCPKYYINTYTTYEEMLTSDLCMYWENKKHRVRLRNCCCLKEHAATLLWRMIILMSLKIKSMDLVKGMRFWLRRMKNKVNFINWNIWNLFESDLHVHNF